MSYIDQITVGLTTYDIQDSTVPAWARASNAPQSLPSGGTTGQVLTKTSDSDYAAAWSSLIDDTQTASTTTYSSNKINLTYATLNQVYPVGAIYMSVDSTSPASLFGGTWERITGKFLLAATDNGSSGASQAAGNTGGSATVTLVEGNMPSHSHSYDKVKSTSDSHTLTTTEMPKHKHNLAWAGSETELVGLNSGSNSGYWLNWNSGKNSYNLTTTTTGGGGGHTHGIGTSSATSGSKGSGTAHENMPPYLAVYVWKRTA